MAESRLLGGPIEEEEAGFGVSLEGEGLGKILGGESWRELREGLLE